MENIEIRIGPEFDIHFINILSMASLCAIYLLTADAQRLLLNLLVQPESASYSN